MRGIQAALAIICSLALTALPAVSAHAKAAKADATFGPEVELRLPRNADLNQNAYVYGMACPGVGDCVAASQIISNHGDEEAIVFMEVAGSWKRRATRLLMPHDAGLTPPESPSGIACSIPRHCVAVGSYTNAAGNQRGFADTESLGRWYRASAIQPPRNAAASGVGLQGVSCPRRGYCEAIGSYTDRGGRQHALEVTQVHGHWRRAVELTIPSMNSISCWRRGYCAAVGNGSGALETAGHWGRAVQIRLPKHSHELHPSIDQVACAPSGRCIAVGITGLNPSGYRAISVTGADGHWTRAINMEGPDSAIYSVSCVRSSTCYAVGGDQILTWSSGKWSAPVSIAVPANAVPGGYSNLAAVGCSAAGYCAAAGFYKATCQCGIGSAPYAQETMVTDMP